MTPMVVIGHREVMAAGLVKGELSIRPARSTYLPTLEQNNVIVRSNVSYKSLHEMGK